ncbi:AMP-binding protein [Bacteriovoracales bacterium]|nr:AMP-binding protein [Bacteriovoracales bacterium]
MSTKEYRTPLEMFYKWEKEKAESPVFKWPQDGSWHELTWEQAGDQVRRVAKALKDLDLPAGSHIGILSKNCPYWIMTDIAIWMAGHVSVPLYPNLTAETVNTILTHSNTKVLFVGKLDGWEDMKPGIPSDVKCFSYPYGNKGYEDWTDLCAKNEPITENIQREYEEVATIIYTSGTTGVPKGVIHNFLSFSCAGENGTKLAQLNPNDRFFSYLPLSHVAERLLVETCGLYCGGLIYFAESLDTFVDNLKTARPTVFLSVPRLWTKFQMGILGKLPQKKLNTLLKIPFVSGLIKRKVLKGLGLDQARIAATGAAPISLTLLEWWKSLGLTILEGYGMTENFAYSHLNLPNEEKFGFVGQAMPGVNVRLSDEGEIQIKNECLMDGYYKEPVLTDEVFADGYLRTGDQGSIDQNGYLKITGRVKDLFKTGKGKYVVPSPIELKISKSSLIEQVCVAGNGLPQPIALINLSEDGKNRSKEEVTQELQGLMSEINPTIDHHERPEKFIIVRDDWSVENNVLTPTMKIKRNVVEKTYQESFEGWYDTSSKVIWSDQPFLQ